MKQEKKVAISVQPIVLKWCRKERKKIQVKKESQQNQSRWRIWYHDTAWRIRTCLPRLHQKTRGTPKSESQKVPLSYVQQTGTRPVMLASSSNSSEMEQWRQVVFSGAEIWWNVGSECGGNCVWRVGRRYWCGLWRRRRMRPFSEMTIIPEQSEWPIAKDAEPFTRRFNARQWQTFHDLGNVYVFNIGSICIHGKELRRQFTFHQKYSGKSHFKEDVREIWTVDIGTIGRYFGVSQISWENVFSDSVSWKGESEPNIK